MKKARAVKRAKEQAYWLTWTITGRLQFKPSGKVSVMVRYYPPDKRKRDQDNMEAAMKSSFDGIAQALGIDDHLFQISSEVMPDTDNRVVVFLNFEAEVIRQGQVA